MKKMAFIVMVLIVFMFAGCVANSPTADLPLPTPLTLEMTKPPTIDTGYFLTSTIVPFYTQVPSPTYEGTPAYVTIALDLGGGGAGFSANLYAQEVYTGKTVGIFMSAGMHTASHLPTSAPMVLPVPAPGTYVFYARLSNDPMDYHYGYTECTVPTECVGSPLIAVDVLPGETYSVRITDRRALLPEINERGLPVTVPWIKLK